MREYGNIVKGMNEMEFVTNWPTALVIITAMICVTFLIYAYLATRND